MIELEIGYSIFKGVVAFRSRWAAIEEAREELKRDRAKLEERAAELERERAAEREHWEALATQLHARARAGGSRGSVVDLQLYICCVWRRW